jgi:hypothetical protein
MERMASGGGANSMLRFRLEREGDVMKHYQKMKRRQRACLGSMERKHDTTWRHGNVGRRRGSTGKERRHQLG